MIRRLINFVRGLRVKSASKSPLSVSIDLCVAKMEKREERMRDLWQSVDRPGMDEHIAALGGCNGEYSRLANKQERTGSWLMILLRKRGLPEDLRLAEAIRVGAWP